MIYKVLYTVGKKGNIVKEIIWKYNNDYITFRVRMVKKKKHGNLHFFFLKDLNYTINSGHFYFFFNFVYFFY